MAVGPVEYLVIAFPGSRFTGSVAPALAGAVSSGAVRAGDLAFVRRSEGGVLASVELRELDPGGAVPADAAEGGAAAVLGAEDVDRLDGSVPSGDVVAIVVREDLWTTRLARTAREAGGTFVAHERLGAGGDGGPGGSGGSGGSGGEDAAGDDIITRLERLAELWKRDVLTDAEFVEQKTKLLSD
ncbi:SHOCT domain-containing protein [Streptomyces sp. SM11]|uniref:SHOCT domain-containing protein n=1 Tax=Streptomyces sp. SM11 TaxID=565557 RepID=UPI000CD500A5|nr:SHOCT domain-containing protein [Streptomyces sp. SM11]